MPDARMGPGQALNVSGYRPTKGFAEAVESL